METENAQDIAESIFGDISNPAVETAIANGTTDATSSGSEQVQPEVKDFKVEDHSKPTEVNDPAVPVVPAVAPEQSTPAVAAAPPPAATPATSAAPAVSQPPTGTSPEQWAQFQAWQAQQQAVATGQFQQPQVQQPVPQMPQPVQQAPKQLTQEEIDKAINKRVVSVDEFNSIFSETDPKKATDVFNGILQGVAVQAATMAHHLIVEATSRLDQQYRPYAQFADSQRELVLREQFFAANPDLVGQDVLINVAQNELNQARAQGRYNPTSAQQVFQDVATRTKALIAGMQRQGQPSQVATTQQQPPQAAPNGKGPMAVLPTVAPVAGAPSAPNQAAPGESQIARDIFG